MLLSIVIPVYNECDSLEELVRNIQSVAHAHRYQLEILMVDDGSTDGSWQRIVALAQASPQVRGLKLRRNFGKAAALAAAFDAAHGQRLITMDADLQDDPNEIPALLAKLDEGFDVVTGWKQVRHDPWHKVGPSRIFNRLISWLTGVRLHDHNCGLKAYRSEVISEVKLYGEMHRFVPVLAAARGFRIAEIPVRHQPRMHGVSKYGFERFIKGLLDLFTVYFLTGFRNRPQHLLGSLGLASLAFGSIGWMVLTVWWVWSRLANSLPEDDLHLHERAIFYYCIVALLLGVQLLSVGFIAEMITAQNRPHTKPYSLGETTSFHAGSDGPSDPSSLE
ncbi:MAG: glycosyltransferase family 2 protein [Pirellulaceae bacterium]|nr:glycosyltransferase family 2 protein [Pirellulaceae bacterium]